MGGTHSWWKGGVKGARGSDGYPDAALYLDMSPGSPLTIVDTRNRGTPLIARSLPRRFIVPLDPAQGATTQGNAALQSIS